MNALAVESSAMGAAQSAVAAGLGGARIEVPKPLSIYEKFVELGYSPIPRYKIDGIFKWPLGWSGYCDQQADEGELTKWARHDTGVALCGGFENLLAVDVDTDDPQIKKAVLDALPHCRVGRFGSKGFALFVLYQGERIPDILPADETKTQPIVEFKGKGTNITVPPSLHAKTGKPYVWLNPETGEAIDGLPPVEELPILSSGDAERVLKALAPYSRAPKEPRPAGANASVTVAGDKRIAAYFKAGYESETKALAALTEGRPTEFFRAVCRLGWGVAHSIIGKAEFSKGFIDACSRNGLLGRDGIRAIEATIHSGLDRAANDPLPELEDRQEPGIQFCVGEGADLFRAHASRVGGDGCRDGGADQGESRQRTRGA